MVVKPAILSAIQDLGKPNISGLNFYLTFIILFKIICLFRHILFSKFYHLHYINIYINVYIYILDRVNIGYVNI